MAEKNTYKSRTGDELIDSLYDKDLMRLHRYKHETIGANFSMWYFKARGLEMTCQAIEKDILERLKQGKMFGQSVEAFIASEMYPVYLMLMGMRLEVYLKGSLVLIYGKWKPSFAGHDLLMHCQNAKLNVSGEEKNVLNQLTSYVKWAGRYPIPMKPEAYMKLGNKKEGVEYAWMKKGLESHLKSTKIFVEGFEHRLIDKIQKMLRVKNIESRITKQPTKTVDF